VYTRRQVVQGAGAVGLGLLAGCGRLPWSQPAPRGKVQRIVVFAGSAVTPASANIDAFHQGLRELGYVEGQSVTIEYCDAPSDAAGAVRGAAELLSLAPDVILVAGGNPVVRAAQDATSTIPIVMAQAGVDPVATGLVTSYARPGGNVTGLTQITAELSGKRLEVLKDLIPGMSRVAVLWNPNTRDKAIEFRELQAAAQTLGVVVQSLEVRDADELSQAFEAAAREQAAGLVVLQEGLTLNQRGRIAELALQGRLPTMYESRYFVEAGGLLAYGVNLPDLYRRAAVYVDRILRGARPADLPVERPVRFDVVINLQTAQALGLTIPHHVLLQATEVIQ
jgi:putative ABC transport system substrate-binding protein